jgi:hypothetical protein
MKQFLALLLTAALLLCLFGCTTEKAPYVPTGDALDSGEGNTVAPPVQKDQQLSLIYYPTRSLNPYSCTDFTTRAIFPCCIKVCFPLTATTM